ncbi:PaaI family thioesterase [Capnocytophaga catalasegens]|uniref:Acyl-CoA esterase n=1 Tax=Capnocytophaga catalasegens TaxID=1004260 RepID=A0AAV5AXF4_9FLAO|nr:PaaI family thioesterase [Capnocytophaga catalasegens]GIZ16084.1 acyl-CoA esterase [Capnocytophaga catalasegens]GJM50243.1 acyl-CoA esterase [Capnocytophaga catalasegens]GJM53474.1 acyl-CoA esterase [Capnocytophaga catalasegens]
MIDKNKILEKCNKYCQGTLMETLGIEYIDVNESELVARMPITQKVCQPNGVLHGGASAAVAESVGSMAAMVLAAQPNEQVLGIDIMMNHVRGVKEGYVYATATSLHKGRTLQHWDIKITDEQNRLIAYGKHTTIIIKKNDN